MEGPTTRNIVCDKCRHRLDDRDYHVPKFIGVGEDPLHCIINVWNFFCGSQKKYAGRDEPKAEVDKAAVMPLISVADGIEQHRESDLPVKLLRLNLEGVTTVEWLAKGPRQHRPVRFTLDVIPLSDGTQKFLLTGVIMKNDQSRYVCGYTTSSPMVLRPLLFLLPKVFCNVPVFDLNVKELQPPPMCIYRRSELPICSSSLHACAMIDNFVRTGYAVVTADGINFGINIDDRISSEFAEFDQGTSGDLKMLHGYASMASHGLWRNKLKATPGADREIAAHLDKKIMMVLMDHFIHLKSDGRMPENMGRLGVKHRSGKIRATWAIGLPDSISLEDLIVLRLTIAPGKTDASGETYTRRKLEVEFNQNDKTYMFYTTSSIVIVPVVTILQQLYPRLTAEYGINYDISQMGYYRASHLEGYTAPCVYALVFDELEEIREFKIGEVIIEIIQDGSKVISNGVAFTESESHILKEFSKFYWNF